MGVFSRMKDEFTRFTLFFVLALAPGTFLWSPILSNELEEHFESEQSQQDLKDRANVDALIKTEEKQASLEPDKVNSPHEDAKKYSRADELAYDQIKARDKKARFVTIITEVLFWLTFLAFIFAEIILIQWIQRGASISLKQNLEVGVNRLSQVVGVLCASSLAINFVWKSEFYTLEVILLAVSLGAFGYLFAKTLVRSVFWIKEGFSR
jgi:hypothetical protein